MHTYDEFRQREHQLEALLHITYLSGSIVQLEGCVRATGACARLAGELPAGTLRVLRSSIVRLEEALTDLRSIANGSSPKSAPVLMAAE